MANHMLQQGVCAERKGLERKGVKKMKKNLKKCMALLLAGCFLFSGCQGTTQEGSTEQKAENGDNLLMGKLKMESYITESWTESTEENGDVKINIKGLGMVPNVDSMSVVNAGAFRLTAANRKQIVTALLGEDCYAYDEKKLSADPENLVKKSPGSFTSNFYAGECDGIEYLLDFEQNENGADYFIHFYPRSMERMMPDGIKEDKGLKYYAMESMPGADNSVKMTSEQAREKLEVLLKKLGFSDMVEDGVMDLYWKNDLHDSVRHGYVFVMEPGVDNLPFDTFTAQGGYVSGSSGEKEEDNAKEQDFTRYFLDNTMEVCITEKGIMDVKWNSPVALGGITKNVKLLDYPQAMAAIKSNMKDYIKDYAAYCRSEGRDMENGINFNKLSLIYCRVSQGAGDYTFVPAWCLENSANDVAGCNMLINAIDGTYMRSW